MHAALPPIFKNTFPWPQIPLQLLDIFVIKAGDDGSKVEDSHGGNAEK